MTPRSFTQRVRVTKAPVKANAIALFDGADIESYIAPGNTTPIRPGRERLPLDPGDPPGRQRPPVRRLLQQLLDVG